MKEGGDRRIIVTDHAVTRFRQRRALDRRDREIREEIRREVREAILGGRIQNHRPKAFRLYRERRKGKLDPGDRFVWNEEGSIGWIVRRESHADVVMTTCVRTNAVDQETSSESMAGSSPALEREQT